MNVGKKREVSENMEGDCAIIWGKYCPAVRTVLCSIARRLTLNLKKAFRCNGSLTKSQVFNFLPELLICHDHRPSLFVDSRMFAFRV